MLEPPYGEGRGREAYMCVARVFKQKILNTHVIEKS